MIVDFPYEIRSCKECGHLHGKWALYVTAEPQVEISVPGEGVSSFAFCLLFIVMAFIFFQIRIKRTCRTDDPDGINPLKLSVSNLLDLQFGVTLHMSFDNAVLWKTNA